VLGSTSSAAACQPSTSGTQSPTICLSEPEGEKIEVVYEMFPNLSRECISMVIMLCRRNTTMALQVLIDTSCKKILRLVRSRKLKTSVVHVEIDPNTLLLDGLKLYKDPSFDITRPIEIAFKGTYMCIEVFWFNITSVKL
jgi:hypothetical protein